MSPALNLPLWVGPYLEFEPFFRYHYNMQWLDEGKAFTFLDVRSPGEYSSAHIPGAVSIPAPTINRSLDQIEAAGGKPVVTRVGHSFIKATMREHDSPFGGELAGHFYYRSNFTADSSIMTVIEVLNHLRETSEPLSKLVEPLRRYHATGEINFHVDDKDAMIARLGDEALPKDIADELLVTRGNVTGLIQRLESAELIELRPHPVDGPAPPPA